MKTLYKRIVNRYSLTILLIVVISLSFSNFSFSQESWTPTLRDANTPAARNRHSAVWTGSNMIIWGGANYNAPPYYFNTGGIYDPSANTWSATSTTGAPTSRSSQTAIWTGTKMIIWGGANSTGYSNTGGIYDPSTNTWTATSTTNAPVGRIEHIAIWTGSKMIVWGGYGPGQFNTGGVYDPSTNTWTATSMINAPQRRYSTSAIWTGSKMIIWGGYCDTLPYYLNSGGIYDPATDTWTATSITNAPSGRQYHTSVWTGTKMIVWGGGKNTGGIYDPSTDTWTATSTTNAPPSRGYQLGAWTGNKFIVWGGYNYPNYVNTGGVYDPATDTWLSTTIVNAPNSGQFSTSVWTGNKMIVWGGVYNSTNFLDSGGVYVPPSVYTWQTGNGDWQTSGNWSPSRTTIAGSDILQFNNGQTITLTNVPTESEGQILVYGNTNVTLPSSGSTNFTLSKNGTGLFISNGSQLSLGTVNVNQGSGISSIITGGLYCGTGIISGAGSFTLASGGTVGIGSTAGIYSDGSANGNVQVTGGISYNTGANYVYNGANAQNTGPGLPTTINSLTINNSSGVTLTQNASVSSSMAMINGNISTGSYTLTLGTSTSALGTLSRTSGTIIGNFKRWFSNVTVSNVLFPVGTSSNYRAINISFTSAPTSGGTLTATHKTVDPGFNGHPYSINDGSYIINNYSNTGYWTITASSISGGTYNLDITADGFLNGITPNDYTKLHLLKRTNSSSDWSAQGTHIQSDGSTSTPILHRTGLNSFSDLAVGSNMSDNNLSVILLSTPVLVSPANGAINVPTTVSFDWNSVTGATSYRIQVAADSAFTSVLKDSTVNADSLTLAGFSPNSLYYWKVVAINNSGTGLYSATYNFRIIIALPSAPVLVSPANGVINLQPTISFDWNSVPTATSYRIKVATDPAFTAVVKDSIVNIDSLILTGFSPNSLYYWKVAAINIAGTGAYSDIWNFRIIPDIPSAPVLVSPANGATNLQPTILFDWNSVPTATSYRIQVATDPAFTAVVKDSIVNIDSLILTSFSTNSLYYWKVAAINIAGIGAYSDIWNFRIIPDIPPAPVLVSPANGVINLQPTILFKWNSVPTATSYRIKVATDSTFTAVVKDSIVIIDSLILTDFSPNGLYYWKVAAINIAGTGAYSDIWNFRVIPSIPPAPVLVSPANGTTNLQPTILFKWNSVPTATSYRIKVATDTSFTAIVKDSTVSADSLVLSGFLANGHYYWEVAAINISGIGAYSSIWAFQINPTGINNYSSIIPKEFKLHNNFPNPFNPTTKIRFDLPKNVSVKIIVFDITGREIQQLVNRQLSAGAYEYEFNGSNFASGIYFYRIQAGNFTNVKRMVLIK
jgi:N-acetylneuraminic acid mutarotase